MDEINRKYHEVADIFPMMSGDEYDALKADIAQNGQREPIWLHPDGRIVDGRNRHRACVDLNIAPHFRTWDGTGSLVSLVVSLNLHRRHLTSGQKAIIGAEILPLLEEEGRQAKIRAAVATNVKLGRITHDPNKLQTTLIEDGGDVFVCPTCADIFRDEVWHCEHCDHHWPMSRNYCANCYEKRETETLVELFPQASDEKSRDKAAALIGTNGRYVSDAKRLMSEAPDLAQHVKAGDMKITEARRQLQQRQKQEAPPLPTDKYRIIYADPPWKYSNSGSIETANGREVFTRVEQHYPTMSIDELCAMGSDIRQMADDNAVLFLWVTSPMLEVAFPIIKAWGFQYKTSIVWNKVRHTWGHYVSVRHELLLICTKGSCTPDINELHNSVVTLERTDKNSEKPAEFRQLINKMYTHGKRIELFSRNRVDGWEVWGNEC